MSVKEISHPQINRQTGKQANIRTVKHTYIRTDGLKGKWTDRQMNREVYKQTYGKTVR